MNSTKNISSAQAHKTQPEEFDLVILGGGTGSTIAAWTFAGEGKQVAVIERQYIGGSCPNIACLPSKNIIHSAKVASYFRRSKEFGITHDGFTIAMAGVRDRKRTMVSGMHEVYLNNYRHTGAEFIWGTGRFIAPRTLEVALPDGTSRHLRGTNVIVSTGTRATLGAIPGLADAQPLTHIEALELDEVPAHLLVVGGGYVGIELSQAMRRFGSAVSVIDRNERLMAREDDDVCEALRRLLEDEGIDLLLHAQITRVSGHRDSRSASPSSTMARRRPWRAVMCWSRQAARRILRDWGWRWPASRSPTAATSGSTSACRRPRPACGRSARWPAARSLPTSAWTISVSCMTTSSALTM